MNIPKQCDVVVIGGGPSGSLAATYLAQKGYSVILLEAKKHPRPHVGENILPHFWKYTDLANVSDKIAAEGFIEKAGGTAVWDGAIRQMSFRDFGYTRPGLHIERDRFDHILLNHAQEQGAQIFEEITVVGVEFDDEHEIQTVFCRPSKRQRDQGKAQSAVRSIKCRFIVDASGQRALIAQQLGIREIDNDFRFMSLWAYFTGSTYIGLDGKAHSHETIRSIPPTTFVTSIHEKSQAEESRHRGEAPASHPHGWAWHIPMREKASVGLVLPLDVVRSLPKGSIKAAKAGNPESSAWQSYFLDKCREIPYLSDLLKDAQFCEGSLGGIQDYSYRSTQLAGPGFFLIGDAAGFIDPVFSAGITIGMYSAYLAAWAIDRSFKESGSTERNQSIFAGQLESRLEVARSLAIPGYQLEDRSSQVAKSAIHFESLVEQQLMGTASQMTTRAANFTNLLKGETGEQGHEGPGDEGLVHEGQSVEPKLRVFDRLAV